MVKEDNRSKVHFHVAREYTKDTLLTQRLVHGVNTG